MTLEQFTEHIAEYHDRLLNIATENWFAILILSTISDEQNGSNTFWITNMDKEWITTSNLNQSAYAYSLYNTIN